MVSFSTKPSIYILSNNLTIKVSSLKYFQKYSVNLYIKKNGYKNIWTLNICLDWATLNRSTTHNLQIFINIVLKTLKITKPLPNLRCCLRYSWEPQDCLRRRCCDNENNVSKRCNSPIFCLGLTLVLRLVLVSFLLFGWGALRLEEVSRYRLFVDL